MYSFFGFLAPPLGYVLSFIYDFLGNYGWAIIIFTVLIRVVLFPLAVRQQKATARMNAYQPLIKEIQKKWANDRNRQNQEVQKFYQENNIKMNVGCLPMIINLIVLFGIIAVIQAPMQYIVHVPTEQIQYAVEVVQTENPDITKNTYTQQSLLIGYIKEDPEKFVAGVDITDDSGSHHVAMSQEYVNDVVDFDFDFLGLNLAAAPGGSFQNLILPILSVVTMLGSQVIIMLFGGAQGGAQGKASMMIMTLVMGVIFAIFAFRVPIGFSLYYTISNIIMLVQQLLVKKIHDPKKIQEQLVAEIEERRKAKKERQKLAPVVVSEGVGLSAIDTENLTESQAVKLRLERARQLDAMKYGDVEEQSPPPRKKDGKPDASPSAETPPADETPEETPPVAGEDAAPEEEAEPAAPKPEYKPGRRRRASQKKEDESASFADLEMQAEKEAEQAENEQNTSEEEKKDA